MRKNVKACVLSSKSMPNFYRVPHENNFLNDALERCTDSIFFFADNQHSYLPAYSYWLYFLIAAVSQKSDLGMTDLKIKVFTQLLSSWRLWRRFHSFAFSSFQRCLHSLTGSPTPPSSKSAIAGHLLMLVLPLPPLSFSYKDPVIILNPPGQSRIISLSQCQPISGFN